MSLKELGLLLGVLALWIVLSRWVLPWFGIRTCMSGACGADPHRAVTETEKGSQGAEQAGDTR
jgi:hypothetical protein